MLTHLWLYRSPRKARGLADDVTVDSWAHHYPEYNRMADLVVNITMDTKDSIQVHAPTDRAIAQN